MGKEISILLPGVWNYPVTVAVNFQKLYERKLEMILYKVRKGENIHDVVSMMIRLAEDNSNDVESSFNGVPLVVTTISQKQAIIENYFARFKEKYKQEGTSCCVCFNKALETKTIERGQYNYHLIVSINKVFSLPPIHYCPWCGNLLSFANSAIHEGG